MSNANILLNFHIREPIDRNQIMVLISKYVVFLLNDASDPHHTIQCLNEIDRCLQKMEEEIERLHGIEAKAIEQSELIQREWLSPIEAEGLKAENARLREILAIFEHAHGIYQMRFGGIANKPQEVK